MLKKLMKSFRVGEKGFTLVEMLIVIAILGVLSAVAVPNIGKFIDTGKNKAYETEKHSVEMAAMALIVDSISGEIDEISATATSDLSEFTSETLDGTRTVADYMTGLTGTSVSSRCTYTITHEGVVVQTPPAPAE